MTRDLTCPLCAGRDLIPVFKQADVPVLLNRPFPSADAAREIARGQLDVEACCNCGYVFNAEYDPDLLSYDCDYENTQTHSGLFAAYEAEVAAHLTKEFELHGKLIADVGCGKGHFLHALCAEGKNRGLGIDATYEGPLGSADGAISFRREHLVPGATIGSPDLVCCRHVLEHVESPVDFLKALRGCTESPKTAFYLEVPDFKWILEHTAFWDLYYEHRSYFFADSLKRLMLQTGFASIRIRNAFGGQYMGAMASVGCSEGAAEASDDIAELVVRFRERQTRVEDEILAEMENQAARGECVVWGAGAKGVAFVNRLDPECRLIARLLDINPSKQDKYTPGTGHRIEGPSPAALADVSTVFIMNPVYEEEIAAETRRWARSDTVLRCV